MKTLEESKRPTKEVLSPLVKWIKDKASKFNPASNTVETSNGDTIEYDYMVVASGIECHYEKIPGLLDALKIPKGPVCSIYSPQYVNRVYDAFQAFRSGNAIFTFPNSPVKCPGAPQKICYIFEHYLRRNKKKSGAKIFYNTSLPNIFGVKHYADALWEVARKRDITVGTRTNLVEVLPSGREAVFENLDSGDKFTKEFSLLHVTPPMSTSEALKSSGGFFQVFEFFNSFFNFLNPPPGDLVNEAGFVNVNRHTLRHMKYPNIFALGDCSSSPNSKTAAAAAVQSQVVFKNLSAVMEGGEPVRNYDGYASCPLVTGYNSCILAEFDYNLQPLETFPFEQAKERFSMFVMKKDLMAPLYWNFMMNGIWNGEILELIFWIFLNIKTFLSFARIFINFMFFFSFIFRSWFFEEGFTCL